MSLNIIRGEVKQLNTLVTQEYDTLSLTWANGLITTIVYKKSNSAIAILTLSYDSNNNITEVVKT